jgi:hypothetical protein
MNLHGFGVLARKRLQQLRGPGEVLQRLVSLAQLLVLDPGSYATRGQTDPIPDDLGIVTDQLFAQVHRLLVGLVRIVRAADCLERHSQVMLGHSQVIVEFLRTLPRQLGP